MILRRSIVLPLFCLIGGVASLNAKVVRVEVTSRADVLNGQTFGSAGAYERVVGRVYFSVSVANSHNRRIADVDKAVNLRNGEVEFSSDFVAVRPKDSRKGNGSLLLEVPNRGRARIIGIVDGGDWDLAKDAGDAWLLRNGYTIVSLGWQWDATGQDALRFYAPIAKENGKTITGLLRGDLMPWKVMDEIPPRAPHHRRYRWDRISGRRARRPAQRAHRPGIAQCPAHGNSPVRLAIRPHG